DETPSRGLTPETYFGVGKMVNFGGGEVYDRGSATFAYPPTLPAGTFALSGRWSLDSEGATVGSDSSRIKLNYHARNGYLVVGGTGNITATRNGKSTTLPINGAPQSHQIVAGDAVVDGTIEVQPSQGLQVYSFTYG